MNESELKKLLKEAAGPSPLPSDLRARLEAMIEDRAARVAVAGSGSSHPLPEMLRKRLERQLTAPHRLRRSYRRLQVFSGIAASLILITFGVGYVARVVGFGASDNQGTAAGPRPNATPLSPNSQWAVTGKPDPKPSKSRPKPRQLINSLAVAAEKPEEAPSDLAETPMEQGGWHISLFKRQAACQGDKLEGNPYGTATLIQQGETPGPSPSPAPEPSPSLSPEPASTNQAMAFGVGYQSASGPTPTSTPEPEPSSSPPTFTAASNPTLTLTVNLEFERKVKYWLLLMTYSIPGNVNSCNGATYFDEWLPNELGTRKVATDNTTAPGTYVFRVVLQPIDGDQPTFVSEEFVAEVGS